MCKVLLQHGHHISSRHLWHTQNTSNRSRDERLIIERSELYEIHTVRELGSQGRGYSKG
jgi:hypothetical protein